MIADNMKIMTRECFRYFLRNVGVISPMLVRK